MKKFPLLIVLMLTMAVTAFAAPPVASNFSATASTVGATLIQMQGSDPDGTALTFSVASGPAHGTLSGLNTSNGYVVFTPANGYVGTDSFTFTVTSGGQTSAAATATITITNAKTRIVDTLVDVSGNPRAGKVTFVLTQKVQSPSGLIPLSGSVSAVLNGSGQFDLSVYPSTALSPQAFYQVKFTATGSFKEELIGVYAIPASTMTITLAPYRVTDTNLAAQYVFVDYTAMNSVLSVASGAAAIYTGTPADDVLQRYDAATGKLENSPVTATDSTVTINTTNGVAINAAGLQPAAALQVDSTTRGFLPPRLTTTQRTAMPEVQQGLHLFNTTTNRPNVFTTGWNEVAYMTDIPSVPVTSVFGRTGAVVAASNDYSFSQISGSVTDSQVPNTITLDSFSQIGGSVADAQVPDTITLTSFSQIGTRDASLLNAGFVPPARLGSGGGGLGTKILADNSTFVLPESLGLVDIVSSADGAYPIIANSHTLTPGYLKQEANGVGLDGTASGPYFRIYSNGVVGATDYTGAELYTETALVRLGGRRGGTFASQAISVQLNAIGNGGTTQIARNGTVNWTFEGNIFKPASNGSVGVSTNPIQHLGMESREDNGIVFWNSGVMQFYLGSNGLNTLSLYDSDSEQTARFNYGPGVYLQAGSGSPEGSVTAGRGSIYSRTSDGHVWRKDSGTGNTGWVDMGAGGGTTINSTNNVIPYRSNSTTFDDSPITRVDATSVNIANAQVGAKFTTFAGFQHKDAGGDYALIQQSTGETIINSASGFSLSFRIGNSTKWQIDSSGNLIGGSDNTLDIGASGATRPRTIYAGTSIVAPKHCYTGNMCDFAGSGTPESAVTADVGSTYRRTDGGAGTSFYVKESGTGNTGWVAK